MVVPVCSDMHLIVAIAVGDRPEDYNMLAYDIGSELVDAEISQNSYEKEPNFSSKRLYDCLGLALESP